ncbi:MAG: hypothetical protein K0U37_03455 [Gammaproteobacteria bacterium]|nr:hypothetical protein [Gammaproteobacteria bacterium]
MAKGRKSKSHNKSVATQKDDGLSPYLIKVIAIFNGLYKTYNDSQQRETFDFLKEVSLINEMHQVASSPDNLPALFCYLSYQKLDANGLQFLSFLKQAGLTVEMPSVLEQNLIEKAFKNKDVLFLRWLLEDCGMIIRNSGGLNSPDEFLCDIASTNILQYIEDNLGSPDVSYFIDAIAMHHISGNTILHLAAIHNHPILFRTLVTSGYDINIPNFVGVTPLMYAVEYEREDIIDFSFEQEIDVSLRTEDNETIFHKAILAANEKVFQFAVRRLEQQGLSFSELTVEDGFNLAHWAIEKKQCALLGHISAWVDFSLPGPDGNHLAVFAFIHDEPDTGDYFASQFALKIDRDTFQDGKTIFQIVIEHDALASFLWLLGGEYFEITDKSKEGLPPLLLAAKSGSLCILDELLNVESDFEVLQVDARTEDGKGYGHYLAEHNFFELVEEGLDSHQIKLACKDNDGNTMLDIALSHGESHRDLSKLCIEYIERTAKTRRDTGIRLSSINQLSALLPIYCADDLGELNKEIDGMLPLQLACIHFDMDYVSNLVTQYELNINEMNGLNETALCILIRRHESQKVIEFVQRFNPKVTNLDGKQSTLLHLACEEGLNDLVEWCLKKYNLSALKPRKDKFSALDIVLIRRNSTILKLLWSELTPTQKKVYINVLQAKNEQVLVDYLIAEGLYSPEIETPVKVEIDAQAVVTTSVPVASTVIAEVSRTEETKKVEADTKVVSLFKCDAQILFDAIKKRNLEYFRALKHYDEFDGLIAEHVQVLLSESIKSGYYPLVYRMLRVPVIQQQAHFNHNEALTLACEMGLEQITEALLRNVLVATHLDSLEHPAIQAATENGHHKIVALLKQYVDANAYDEDRTFSSLTSEINTVSIASSTPCLSVTPRIDSQLSQSDSSQCLSSLGDTDRETPLSVLSGQSGRFKSILSPHDNEILNTEIKTVSIVTPLKRPPLPSTQLDRFDILDTQYAELKLDAKVWRGAELPICFTQDEGMYARLRGISSNFNMMNCNGYLYGSAQYKRYPNDLDILLPTCSMEQDGNKVYALINLFVSQGAQVTVVDQHTGAYGYRNEDRYVIPILWQGLTLEFVISLKTVQQHASELDCTAGARYLSLRSLTYVYTPGIYAGVDIHNKQYHSIVDPQQSFLYDPRRIFRAVKMMVDEGFTLSQDCQHAIKDIFSGHQNPFISHISLGKIYNQVNIMLQSRHCVAYFEKLNELGLFNKLYDLLVSVQGYSGQYYRDRLMPFYDEFKKRRENEMPLHGAHPNTIYGVSEVPYGNTGTCDSNTASMGAC